MQARALLMSILLLIATLIAGAFAALAQDDATADDLDAVKRDFITTYADIVYASYEDSLILVRDLQDAIDAFVAEPTEQTFQAAKDAWLAAREPYGQTEAYRFYGGPIDDEDGPEGLINAWPLDEVYIDYVEGAPEAGIINDLETYPEITAELLESLNEQGAEENVSTGFHAIEFLLWGQDFNEDGPGERAYTDYIADGTAPNPERRAQYLALTAAMLVDHLESVAVEWEPDVEDNYRADLLALAPDEAIQRILTGVGVLSKSELAGERMFTAYDNRDQEDEHSCFSDNTHRDIINNYLGIRNVYMGSYVRIDGTEISGAGLRDVVLAADPFLDELITENFDALDAAMTDLYVPFDQAIIVPEGRDQVLDTVFLLQDLGDLFSEVAISLNITINTALPE